MEISRRVTIAWITAAASATLTACDSEPASKGPQIGRWKDLVVEPVKAAGYGQDPNLVEPVTPWPLTLDKPQRETLRIAADLMIPADDHSPSAGSLNIDAFIDEWISAPYPVMQADRALIMSGLAWLDAESQHQSGRSFARASEAERRKVFDLVAWKNKVQPDYARPRRILRAPAHVDDRRLLFAARRHEGYRLYGQRTQRRRISRPHARGAGASERCAHQAEPQTGLAWPSF